jgi:hypothetical protein
LYFIWFFSSNYSIVDGQNKEFFVCDNLPFDVKIGVAHPCHDIISGFPSQIRHPCGGELLPNTTKFLNNFRIGENNTTAEKNILKQKK